MGRRRGRGRRRAEGSLILVCSIIGIMVVVRPFLPPSPSSVLSSINSTDSSNETDVGKVLCGIQVPENLSSRLDEWLLNLSYPFVEETDNALYKELLCDAP